MIRDNGGYFPPLKKMGKPTQPPPPHWMYIFQVIQYVHIIYEVFLLYVFADYVQV